MLKINSLCGMRLPTAGIVIGWVGTALFLLNFVLDLVALVRIDNIASIIIEADQAHSKIPIEVLKTFLLFGFSVYLVLVTVNLVSSILLIVGTLQKRHLMLTPWLICNGFALGINLLSFTSFVWAGYSSGGSFGSVFVLFIFFGLILGLQYLIWTAVYSLFHHIRSQSEQDRGSLMKPPGSATYTKI